MIKKRLKGDYSFTYRPRRMSEVYGQEEIKKIITNGLNDGSLAKSLFFCGPSGTGKTTIARIIAMGLNCENGPTSEPCCDCEHCYPIFDGNSFSFWEYNAGYFSGVEKMREAKGNFGAAPMNDDRYKIYLFDECHVLSTAAQTVLLKEIEDGYQHVYFIFCSTVTKNVLDTLLNRCMLLEFKEFEFDDMWKLLLDICESEGVERDLDVLDTIVKKAKGLPRNALFLLQGVVTAGKLKKIPKPIEKKIELVRSVFKGNSPEITLDINP